MTLKVGTGVDAWAAAGFKDQYNEPIAAVTTLAPVATIAPVVTTIARLATTRDFSGLVKFDDATNLLVEASIAGVTKIASGGYNNIYTTTMKADTDLADLLPAHKPWLSQLPKPVTFRKSKDDGGGDTMENVGELWVTKCGEPPPPSVGDVSTYQQLTPVESPLAPAGSSATPLSGPALSHPGQPLAPRIERGRSSMSPDDFPVAVADLQVMDQRARGRGPVHRRHRRGNPHSLYFRYGHCREASKYHGRRRAQRIGGV